MNLLTILAILGFCMTETMETMLPVGAVHYCTPSDGHYVIIGGSQPSLSDTTKGPCMTLVQAESACATLGGKLADLRNHPDFSWLAQQIRTPVWINSWDGNRYKGVGIAFWPGGAVARPDGAGETPLGALCDVPKPQLSHYIQRQAACARFAV